MRGALLTPVLIFRNSDPRMERITHTFFSFLRCLTAVLVFKNSVPIGYFGITGEFASDVLTELCSFDPLTCLIGILTSRVPWHLVLINLAADWAAVAHQLGFVTRRPMEGTDLTCCCPANPGR